MQRLLDRRHFVLLIAANMAHGGIRHVTRGSDNVFLLRYPLEHITGARLSSGRDVMRNFVFHHLTLKKTLKLTVHSWFMIS